MTQDPNMPQDPNQPTQAPQQPPQAPPPPPQQPPPAAGYPPQQSPGAPPPVTGYAPKPPLRPDEEKLWAIGAHLGPLILGIIAPLVIWLVFKDRSAFLDRHAKEALNFQISYLIYFIVSTVLIILIIGIFMLIAVGIAWVVFMIIATIKASNMEDYRYPLIFRFVN